MAASPNVSKPPVQKDIAQLMRQGEQSTVNLGWLQDYLINWRALRNIANELIKAQNAQKSYDMEARAMLIQMRDFCNVKISDLSEAYDKHYAKHVKLMGDLLDRDDTI